MEARTGPQLRNPRGGYLHAPTSASAWARVLIMGQMTPYTQASRIFMSRPGSFHGTRASGITDVVEMAWSRVTAAGEKEAGMDSQPFTTASPRAQIDFSVFSLTALSWSDRSLMEQQAPEYIRIRPAPGPTGPRRV